jgi:hypothetical protein
MNRENIEPTGQGKAEAFSSAAIARRRILLNGVGKGAAVLAVTVPIQTLASQSLLTEGGAHQCSVSGMHSGVHSKTTTTVTCGGFSPSYWGQSDPATPNVPIHAWPINFGRNHKAVFTRSTLPANLTMFQVMKNHSTTDEAHWISAWLNALNHSFNFPYTGLQVLDFYNSPSVTLYQDALIFFKTYMEAHLA